MKLCPTPELAAALGNASASMYVKGHHGTVISDGICLRSFQARDAAAFVEAVRGSQATLARGTSWCHGDYSKTDAESWLPSPQKTGAQAWRTSWAYSHRETTSLSAARGSTNSTASTISAISVSGCALPGSAKGLRPVPPRALAAFGFQELRLTRIEIVVAVGNVPSQRVAEKIGARFECMARNRLLVHGRPCAASVYSLVPG